MERSDLGRGEFDTSIGALARRLAAEPAASGVLYYCGYALEFNGRTFLLPTSAGIARDYDVLTQGIIAKSLVDSLIRGNEGRGFVLLDVFRTPAASSTAALGGLAEQIRPSNFAVTGPATMAPPKGRRRHRWPCAIRRQKARQAPTCSSRHPPPPGQGRRRDGAVHSGDRSPGRGGRPTQTPPSTAPATSTAIPVPPSPPPPTPEPAIVAPPAAAHAPRDPWRTRIRCPTRIAVGSRRCSQPWDTTRPHRRDLRSRNAGCHSPLSVRSRPHDGPPERRAGDTTREHAR